MSTSELALRSDSLPMGTYEDVERFSKIAARSGLSKSFRTPEQVAMAVQAGKEIGFSAMQSLSEMRIVEGVPRLLGTGCKALILASGQLQKWEEWFEADGKRLSKQQASGPVEDNWTAVWMIQRKGMEPQEGRFSVEDAKAAKLWARQSSTGKDMPWKSYPKKMLSWRAFHAAALDTFADILRGLIPYDPPEITHTQTDDTAAPTPEHDPLSDKIFDATGNEPETPAVEAVVEPPANEPEPEANQDELIKDIESAIKSCSKLGAWQKIIAKECVGENWRQMDVEQLQNGLLVVNELASLMEANGKPSDENELLALISDAKGILTA